MLYFYVVNLELSLETTAFNKVFSLQSGLYCHISGDFIVINDRPVVEARDIIVDLEKTSDKKKMRIAINALLTLSIFTMVFITGFYPLALMIFVTIWDLKNIKRQTLPILVGNCIPIKNISSTKFIHGKLGFNQIDLLITNDNGKQMAKVLNLYDSEEEALKAIGILKELGLMTENPLDENRTILVDQPFFKINENERLYLLEKEIVISKNERYMERNEYVGVNNIIFLFVQFMLTASVFIKIYLMIDKGEFLWADVIVLSLLLLLLPLPLKYFNKSTADLIDKADILKMYTEQKKAKTYLVIEFKSDWILPLKRMIHFEDAQIAAQALTTLQGK